MGSCWDNLRKARREISARKEALFSMELEEGADLVRKVEESLFQHKEEQIESLVRKCLEYCCHYVVSSFKCVFRVSSLTA